MKKYIIFLISILLLCYCHKYSCISITKVNTDLAKTWHSCARTVTEWTIFYSKRAIIFVMLKPITLQIMDFFSNSMNP